MIDPHRYCVIMCGGIGSRFWPYSRTDLPKQFIDFFGTGRTLLQMSYDRILPLVRPENIFVATNADYAPLIRKQLPDLEESRILAEPARRNTAPCIAWAAYHIAALDPEASMIVTPSDHLITRESIFEQCVEKGFDFIEHNDALLTLGITPSRPETGYGYIQIGPMAADGILKVKTFTEKPDAELARVFLDTGEFFWNSGIFMWSAKSVIKTLHACAPDLAAVFDKGAGLFATPAESAFIAREFPGCPAISIDYAVMEKAANVFVECASFGWSDLGTWSALYDHSPKNNQGNVTQRCNVLAYESSGNIFAVNDPGKLIVVKALDNYIVADSDDVLLVCPKADEQEIKQIVNDVKISFEGKYI